MPPREGISIAQFLTVTDIERSARYYEKVLGARILSLLARLPGQVGVTPGIVTAFPFDGETRDGVEAVGPVWAAG
jgi:catechol 2,3-dioxygenase-like lactoylglutathione lyase family enzyme